MYDHYVRELRRGWTRSLPSNPSDVYKEFYRDRTKRIRLEKKQGEKWKALFEKLGEFGKPFLDRSYITGKKSRKSSIMDPIAKENGMIRPEILIPWPYSKNPYCRRGKVRFDEDIPCSPYQLRHRALYEARAKAVVGTLDSLDTPFPIDQLTEEECLLFWQALPFDKVLKAIIYRRKINHELLVEYKVFDYFKEIPGISKKPTEIFMNLQPHLTGLPIDKQLPFFAHDRFGSIARLVIRSMKSKKKPAA